MPFEFRVHTLELQAGLSAITARATHTDDPTAGYLPLADATVEALERGVDNARDMVTTQALVDGTLAVMRQPAVWERLPLEIADRNAIAVHIAGKLGRACTESLLFASLFKYIGRLGKLMTSEDLQALQHPKYMSQLGGLAFNDASFGIGGAHRLLVRKPREEPVADIIARSTGLPGELSKIAKAHAVRAARTLGFPYTLPRYLHEFTNRADLAEVGLTADARKFISTVHDSAAGCPAASISNPYGPGTVLTSAWKEMVAVLVPEGATSKLRNTRATSF